ncbi:3-hydroxyisobutyrate dehydrogenase [Parvularcula marina]|uniref:3-hydroxyisobutyrate dehydrogenase n=1 Tax=Parvularcula marina TaxID=2292771 RepID=A0A371RIK8_9PROT|nr:3-hydroxyisobutyrate dehydrogenase [Parvularcula marina]RFB05289.1 3-hydroxyisobutyrate dehydrogenase [Parvularcula marina]
MSSILFIGLGNMGSGMAVNLVKAGHDVHAFDLSADAVAKLADEGATPVPSLKDFKGAVDVVITMLPAGPHVASVYTSPDGLPSSIEKGTLFIDCSTIDVQTARAVGTGAKERGFPFVDAPVSGGVAAAQGGTLTFMVGGEASDFEKAKPYLDSMGKNVFHAGPLGNGQVAKICNNMLLGISMIGTCEAFHLAEKLGLDAQTFFDISSTASGQCWSMTSYCPAPGPVPNAPSNRDYQPGFAAAMMLKDLRLAQDAAKTAKAPTPLGAHAEQLYALMESAGADGFDFSGVMKLLDGSLPKN